MENFKLKLFENNRKILLCVVLSITFVIEKHKLKTRKFNKFATQKNYSS